MTEPFSITAAKIAVAGSGLGMLATAGEPLDGWARLAIEAPLVAVIGVLLLRTLPQLNEQHRSAVEKLASQIDGLAAELKDSNERLMRLLEGEFRENGSQRWED